ncbi:MAG: ABC transporter permease [Azospirillaceae bacterium]|nr:ABC transporter permease [Azospirillaceae bacterium]
MNVLRPALVAGILLLAWAVLVRVTGIPPYILPSPEAVLVTLVQQAPLLAFHGVRTLLEMVLGFALGAVLGMGAALILAGFRTARRWLLPLLVISQAVPVFALAPVLVLWFGYGMASKVVMAGIVIFFPVTASFYDGLRRTTPGWLDLARVMGGSPWSQLRRIRLPAALPSLASGLRVAAAVAPIGAVLGEWVGASAGLGYLMLHANARVQTALMFAALTVLSLLSVTLYFVVDAVARRLLPWQPDQFPPDERT